MPKKKKKSTQLSHPQKQNGSMGIAAASYSGPLPLPNHLEKYELILPGAAERIFAQAESQTAHRQSLEKLALVGGLSNERLGIIYSLIIQVAAVVGGIYGGLHGAQTTGSVIGGGSIISIVVVFIIGTVSRKNERIKKYKISLGIEE